MKKLLVIVCVAALIVSGVAGCGSATGNDADTPNNDAPDGSGETIRVAGLMDGPISDMGWNASAYNGLLKIEQMGAEISYVESVPVSDHEETLIGYAENDYQLIFVNSDSFQDAVMRVSPDYPDTHFIIINGRETSANVNSFQIADEEQGFLMGVLAALLTETGTVGFVGGMEIPPIMNGETGFMEGVEFIDPEINALSTLIGNFHDAAQAKGVAEAMVANGADVLSPMADVASLGVMEAAQEEQVLAIAPGLGQEESAPDATVVTVIKDTSVAFQVAYELFLADAIEERIYSMGVADGVISLSEWYPGAADRVSEQVRNRVEEIYDKMLNREIVVEKPLS